MAGRENSDAPASHSSSGLKGILKSSSKIKEINKNVTAVDSSSRVKKSILCDSSEPKASRSGLKSQNKKNKKTDKAKESNDLKMQETKSTKTVKVKKSNDMKKRESKSTKPDAKNHRKVTKPKTVKTTASGCADKDKDDPNSSKSDTQKPLREGDFVFVKLKGFYHWPAQIEQKYKHMNGSISYKTWLFGLKEYIFCKSVDTVSFAENRAKYGERKTNNKLFKIGMEYVDKKLYEQIEHPLDDIQSYKPVLVPVPVLGSDSSDDDDDDDPDDPGMGKKRKKTQKKERKMVLRKMYVCAMCDKKLTCRESLNVHVLAHKDLKPLDCKLCDLSFRDRANYRSHVKVIHRNMRPYECAQCSKTCGTKYNLIYHIMCSHSGECNIQCTVCDKKFRFDHALKLHMRIHTGEKPYECPICGRCFNQSPVLKAHIRIHTGEKPYECKVCKKCFKRRTDLNCHAANHDDSKAVNCPECGRKFVLARIMRRHMRDHHGAPGATYTCPECHDEFKTRVGCTQHVKTKHPKFRVSARRPVPTNPDWEQELAWEDDDDKDDKDYDDGDESED